MRKILSWVLLGLGAFLLVTALMAAVWAPDQVKKTPTDTDSKTYLSGSAEKLNPKTGDVEDIEVKALSAHKADADQSDDDVVVFFNYTCANVDVDNPPDCIEGEDDERIVSNGDDLFATDRRDAEAVNGEKYLPKKALERLDAVDNKKGLINKFPFDTEKDGDYTFWDGILQRDVPVTFEGTKDIDGLETYEFNYNVSDEEATVTGDIEGLYSMDKTMWIDPVTGAIIDQEQHEVRTLDNGDPLLDMTLSFTDETVKDNVESAKDNGSSLDLLTGTLPTVGFIVGPILLVVGAVLFVLGRRRSSAHSA